MTTGPSSLPAPHASNTIQQAVVMPPAIKSGTISFDAIARRVFMRALTPELANSRYLYFRDRRERVSPGVGVRRLQVYKIAHVRSA